MLIGVPKEIKNNEFRVGLSPASVQELVRDENEVWVEQDAGLGSGFSDADYITAGAKIVNTPKELFSHSELIIKVKEPQHSERVMLQPSSTLFTYLHLAPDIPQTDELLKSGATCIAYETVTSDTGELPLLLPMSEIAGRISALAGAHFLEKTFHGSGVLISGVPGVAPAKVFIIGGGVVGRNAAKLALGMGADVTVADTSPKTLRYIDQLFSGAVKTVYSTRSSILKEAQTANIVIGAVLIPGASAPKLLLQEDLKHLQAGTVLVDVAIDQGGCFETSSPTTHDNPVFIREDIVHYCVANMPGAYAQTATQALNNATLPYIKKLSTKGIKNALEEDKHFLNGLNVINGELCNEAVALAQSRPFITLAEALKRL